MKAEAENRQSVDREQKGEREYGNNEQKLKREAENSRNDVVHSWPKREK